MKINIKSFILLVAGLLNVTSCDFFEVDETVDPNGASLESVLNNPTQGQINNLAIGLQGSMRNGLRDFYLNTGTVGREVIYSASTDNRYFNELLGTEAANFSGANDPNGIFNTYFSAYSQTRRRAEIFTLSAATSDALTDEGKAGVDGFARTVQAYVMLNLLNMQFDNGIRESFSDLASPGDLLNPGPFTDYPAGLTLIKNLLDDAATQLDAAGTEFEFPLKSGWTGFNTPSDFKKFNRAIAARVAMYQEDWPGVESNLALSFYDPAGSLTAGPYFTFSTTVNDLTNTLWHKPDDSGAPYVIFDEFVADAEAGDTRLSKVGLRAATRVSGFVSSDYEVRMYASNTSIVKIIKNEELILMKAEAQIRKGTPDLPGAATSLNIVRAGAGLATLATAKPAVDTQAEYIDELLNQRRYSLFWEGHRWFDARRLDKVAILPLQGLQTDGKTYVVFENFNRPDAETQWENNN